MSLTDRKVNSIKSNEKEQAFSDGAGLYLRVYPSGNKEWRYRYKVNGVGKWYFLGIYPALSLANARIEAHKAKAMLRNGEDPSDAKKLAIKTKAQEVAKQNARISTQELFNRWVKFDLANRKDNGAEVIRCFQKDVLPIVGALPAEEVTKAHIASITDSCLARGSDRMAKVVLSLIRQMFRFAQDRDIIQTDPTATIRKNKIGKPDTPRERFLSEAEIKELTKKIESAGLGTPTKLAIWIALATGCRIGELIKAKWADFDFKAKTWLIVPENSKNGKPITVHLSNFALGNLKELKQIQPDSVWAYPNKDNTTHLNTKTITKQIGDRQFGERTKLANRSKNTSALLLKGGKWTPHDLRRTTATLMTALGVLPDIADKCLNHLEQNKMRRTYIQNSYTNEMKQAWTLLGERLELLTNQKAGNVITAKFGTK
jgi:integrase